VKEIINELETDSNKKNIRDLYRGINKFKKGYKPRSNLVKDGNGDLLTDSRDILNRRKFYFCQLLHVYGVNDGRQTEVDAAESPAIHKIPVELTQSAGNALRFAIH
jgi:hypothetical protein